MSSVHEQWRPVPGYEGLYEVSDLGRVRSRRKTLKPTRQPHGYYTVSLHLRGEQRKAYVHRLVAVAFLGETEGDVRHHNHNRADNRLANLSWGSRRENITDSVRDRRHAFGKANPHAKLTGPQVLLIRAGTGNRRVLAAEYGVSPGTIDDVRRRVSWTHLPPDAEERD